MCEGVFLAGLLRANALPVGSTSVPGLAAKPTIDIDLVIENRRVLNAVIVKLEEFEQNKLSR